MEFTDFKNLHRGETFLVAGNGENLLLTPPQVFPYVSIGTNTIHKYNGWTPDYYVTVDHRVYREFGADIAEKYRSIHKFVPMLKLDEWQGENFVRFPQSTRDEIRLDKLDEAIAGQNVMHFALQIAYYMGAATILIIGMEHKPGRNTTHFWGDDPGIRNTPPLDEWFAAYRQIVQDCNARGVTILNISEGTHVPEDVIPRGDWRNYESKNA